MTVTTISPVGAGAGLRVVRIAKITSTTSTMRKDNTAMIAARRPPVGPLDRDGGDTERTSSCAVDV